MRSYLFLINCIPCFTGLPIAKVLERLTEQHTGRRVLGSVAQATLDIPIADVRETAVFAVQPRTSYLTLIHSMNAAVCSPGCRNGGSCVSPNRCQCLSAWTGGYCQSGMQLFLAHGREGGGGIQSSLHPLC